MRLARRYAPAGWALVLALLMLGPALGVGYVLTFDMVWVPDLALRSDFLGSGTALPRAVPSDAVVAVLNAVVPGMLLQKVVLLGALVLGGTGIARLVGAASDSLVARLVAISCYVWSPFVVERLVIGHWPVLLCWAVLPWLVVEAARFRDDGRSGAVLPALLLVGSLSANAGLMSAVLLLAVGVSGLGWRTLRLALLALAANAPWLVAGVLHIDSATSSGAGAIFGVHAEGLLPAPVGMLTLGGIWNAEVVPTSREGLVLPALLTVAMLAAAVGGWSPARRHLGPRTFDGLLGLWLGGYLLALLSWGSPGTLGGLADHVPGGGLLRDGGRFLALCAPFTAVLVGAGAARLAGHWRERAPRAAVAVVGALLPLAVMPDAAWGAGGALQPATYPDDYAHARAALDDAPDGDLLVLPFTSYRAPEWNHGHKVLDPLPRFLQPNYLVNDELVVDARVIAGEDPRVPAVLAAIQLPRPADRATALGRLGVSVVARELDVVSTPGYDAEIPGTALLEGTDLTVTEIDAPVDVREVPESWVRALALAWVVFLLPLLLALWNMFYNGVSRMRRGAGHGWYGRRR